MEVITSNNPLYHNSSNELLFNQILGTENKNGTIIYLDVVDHGKELDGTGVLSMKVFTKSIEFSDHGVNVKLPIGLSDSATLDLKHELDNLKLSEFQQGVSNLAIKKIIALGNTNFENLKDKWDSNIEVKQGDLVKAELEKHKINFWPNPFKWFINLFRPKVIVLSHDPITYMRRKLLSKIVILSNYVAVNGRRGPANTMIVNGKLATIIQDLEGFNPLNPRESVSSLGAIYQIGTILGIKVCVDPFMTWNDTRLIMFRKGNKDEPGLHLMYQSNFGDRGLKCTAQGTEAPTFVGNFNPVEVGFFPHKNYVVAPLNVPDSLL